MWDIGRKKITTEYEKLPSLICFVDEFSKTKPLYGIRYVRLSCRMTTATAAD